MDDSDDGSDDGDAAEDGDAADDGRWPDNFIPPCEVYVQSDGMNN